MSEEDLEIAVGYFEAPSLADAVDLLADDVRFVFHGKSRQLAGAQTLAGKDAAVAWLADWFSRFDPDYRMETDDARDLGDGRVLVVTTHDSKGRTSGAPFTQQTSQLMTLRDGKIAQQDFFWSRAEALEAAGLSN